jgi:2,3-bisphosphoglycerate-independent phosphoglycerate mutase
MSKKCALIIMDGWGHGQKKEADAIQNAHVPFVKSLYSRYPHTELVTCGEQVGLPDGQMGNSEVGHLNLGAGRIVYQELQRINVALREGILETNDEFINMLKYVHQNQKNPPFDGFGERWRCAFSYQSSIENLRFVC